MIFGNHKNQSPEPTMSATPVASNGALIFDVSTQDFEARVITPSMEKPVIVEFWAPWCEPCKQLLPLLEKAVNAAGGAVLMAKVNMDDNQELASAMRIQNVPMVFAFFQGKPIDGFQGVVPESQITAFIDKAVQAARAAQPDALDIPESLKAAALAASEKDFAAAQAIYAQILQQDEKNVQGFVGLVRLYIAADALDQAAQMVEHAPDEIAAAPGFKDAKTALELAQAKPEEPVDALIAAVEAKPDDHQTRIDLAGALFAGGQQDQAIEHLLESISMNREWNEEAARKALLKFFEALGHSDPLVIAARKKLSTILFS